MICNVSSHCSKKNSVTGYADIVASRVDVRVIGEERAERNPGARREDAAFVTGHDNVDARAVSAGNPEAEQLERHVHATRRIEVEEEQIRRVDLNRLLLGCQRRHRSAGW